MHRILVSACLLGEPLRYDGGDNRIDHPLLRQWREEGRLVPLCPETAGGLPTPRSPAEIIGSRVITRQGEDVTDAFVKGAEATLDCCRRQDIRIALLAARSPSCGNEQIHDGSFRNRLVPGAGMTARVLQSSGIRVFNPDQIQQAAEYLAVLERTTGEPA